MSSSPKIVEATGHSGGNGRNMPGLGQSIEAAMAEATTRAMTEGVTDPDEIRKRKLAARQAAKDAYAAQIASADEAKQDK